jgi:hypothetical protein
MSLEMHLKTVYHQSLALANAAQAALNEIESLKAKPAATTETVEAPKAEKAPKAPKAPKAEKVVVKRKPKAEAKVEEATDKAEAPSGETRTLAGFTLTVSDKGRVALPSKEEICKRALDLGVDAETVNSYFPSGVKPSNERKVQILKQLDGLAAAA